MSKNKLAGGPTKGALSLEPDEANDLIDPAQRLNFLKTIKRRRPPCRTAKNRISYVPISKFFALLISAPRSCCHSVLSRVKDRSVTGSSASISPNANSRTVALGYPFTTSPWITHLMNGRKKTRKSRLMRRILPSAQTASSSPSIRQQERASRRNGHLLLATMNVAHGQIIR